MSAWTHVICAKCYATREPGRDPVHLAPGYTDKADCCFCGDETEAGIYYLADPATTLCKGVHADDD